MADTVDTKVQLNGKRKYVVRLACVSDGTGETDAVKVDISTLTDLNNAVPTCFAIEEVQWSVQGFTSVMLEFDATVDDEGIIMGTGQGYRCYDPPLLDPRSSGFTGDIVLTSNGAVSGATYDIELTLIKC